MASERKKAKIIIISISISKAIQLMKIMKWWKL
jgi:hypothetical protein